MYLYIFIYLYIYKISCFIFKTKKEIGLKKYMYIYIYVTNDFPGGSDGEVSAYNEGDGGSIPGLGRSPGEGNDNPLQYSCLENSMHRGA